jgi:hypothetical protein
MKLYNKRGNKNYKEKRLLRELETFFAKKIKEDPSFQNEILPASNYEELQKMHSKYVVEDTYIIESSNTPTEETTNNMNKKSKNIEDVEFEETKVESKSGSNTFIDPFNREEPIIRDYVMDGGFKEEERTEPKKTFFEEPTSFDEAFVIPDDTKEEEAPKSKAPTETKTREPKESLNPNFDEMSAGKKKRSTQKFAKYIVEAVSTLSEKGFVWYANADINDAKLAEYEMSGEMDLSLLVSMEDGQEVTVKQFFQVQCAKAELLSKWTDEQKHDMSSALAEVLMEKGVAPTPMQELLLVTLTVIGGQALTLLTLKSQTNSLLNQLRAMNDGAKQVQHSYEEPPTIPQEERTSRETKREEFNTNEYANEGNFDEEFDEKFNAVDELETYSAEMSEEELLLSNKDILTKE